MSYQAMKESIKPYFNEKSIGAFGQGRYALLGAFASSAIALSSSPYASILLIPTLIYTVGKVNLWQGSAKGRPLWKPRISDTFGL